MIMGAYEAATTLLYFVLGAAVLGALTRNFGATLLVAAAYTVSLLSLSRINATHDDAAALLLLGLVLFVVAGAGGLVGQNAARWARRRMRRTPRRYNWH
jgi:hypothetical protein